MILNRIDLVWHAVATSSAQIRLHDMVRHISEMPNLFDFSPVGPDSKEESGIWRVSPYPARPGQKPCVCLWVSVSLSLSERLFSQPSPQILTPRGQQESDTLEIIHGSLLFPRATYAVPFKSHQVGESIR
jgi:hypothetical protein